MLEAVSFPVLLVYTDSPKPNLKSGGYWKKKTSIICLEINRKFSIQAN